MSYDYRKQGSGTLKPSGPNMIGYETQPHQLYPTRFERSGSGSGSASSHFYPQIAKPVGPILNRPPAPVSHPSPASGADIRVAVKPGYRVAPAVQLIVPPTADVPRSLFSFDFELERKILADVERESQRWDSSGANGGAGSLQDSEEDLVVAKYAAMGLNREAVVMALATFGDSQNKVLEFVSSYNLLREMGFPAVAVAGALSMYDNDRERALAHFV